MGLAPVFKKLQGTLPYVTGPFGLLGRGGRRSSGET